MIPSYCDEIKPFYTFVSDGTYYGIAVSVCLSFRALKAQPLAPGSFDQHHERKMPIIFQNQGRVVT